MAGLADSVLPAQSDAHGVLARALSGVRWVTIIVLLLLSLARPLSSRIDVPIWAIILLFSGYNLLVDVLRARVSWLRSYARVAFLDLPVSAAVYACGYELSGPFFSLLVLTLFSGVASTKPRGSILYTVAVMLVVVGLAPTFPFWSPDERGFRELLARLIVLAIVGASTTIVMRQLWQGREEVHSFRTEAERLSELDRLRSEFVASVSHELRTPLTAARLGVGMVETSADDRLRADERQLLGGARRNIESLGILIDDLLAYNQLQAGALELDHQPVDLRAVVTEALPTVHPMIQQKGQALEVDLSAPLPVKGDPGKLHRVVVNLLANAHKHTPSGTRIAISGRVEAGEVLLTVRDNGPGIPPEEREAVFQRFHRLDSATSGSGLGLAIARAIVELHGGRLWLEGQPGAGSAFRIALPYCADGGER